MVMDLLKDRPRNLERDPDCAANNDEQLQNVIQCHVASPLSHLRPGEPDNKVSQPPEACRRKLDHLLCRQHLPLLVRRIKYSMIQSALQ